MFGFHKKSSSEWPVFYYSFYLNQLILLLIDLFTFSRVANFMAGFRTDHQNFILAFEHTSIDEESQKRMWTEENAATI